MIQSSDRAHSSSAAGYLGSQLVQVSVRSNARRRTAAHGGARRRTAAHGGARRRTAAHGGARRRTAAHGGARRRTAAHGGARRRTAAHGGARRRTAAHGGARRRTAAHGGARRRTAAHGGARRRTAAHGGARRRTAAHGGARRRTAAHGGARRRTAAHGGARRRTAAHGGARRRTAAHGGARRRTAAHGGARRRTAAHGGARRRTAAHGGARRRTAAHGGARRRTAAHGGARRRTAAHGGARRRTAAHGGARRRTAAHGGARRRTAAHGGARRRTAAHGGARRRTAAHGGARRRTAAHGGARRRTAAHGGARRRTAAHGGARRRTAAHGGARRRTAAHGGARRRTAAHGGARRRTAAHGGARRRTAAHGGARRRTAAHGGARRRTAAHGGARRRTAAHGGARRRTAAHGGARRRTAAHGGARRRTAALPALPITVPAFSPYSPTPPSPSLCPLNEPRRDGSLAVAAAARSTAAHTGATSHGDGWNAAWTVGMPQQREWRECRSHGNGGNASAVGTAGTPQQPERQNARSDPMAATSPCSSAIDSPTPGCSLDTSSWSSRPATSPQLSVDGGQNGPTASSRAGCSRPPPGANHQGPGLRGRRKESSDCSVSLPGEMIQKTPQGSVLFSAATTTPPRCQLALKSIAWTVSPKADRGAHGWHGVRVASFNGSAIVESKYRGKARTYGEGTSNASLLIKNLTIYDSGYYTVTAAWSSPNCRISMPRKPIQTEVGGSVLFSAQITAAPRCRLASVVWVKAWYSDKNTTRSEAPLQVAAFNGSAHVHPRYRGRAWLYGGNSSKSWLSVKSLTRYDSGFYLVTATWGSDEGEVQSESRQLLSVHYACEVRTQHASLRSAWHETATLLCRARSPLCALEVVAWFRVLPMQDRELILLHNGSNPSHLGPNFVGRSADVRLLWSSPDDASLVLANVSLRDAGTYECQHEWRQGGGFEFSVSYMRLTVTKGGQRTRIENVNTYDKVELSQVRTWRFSSVALPQGQVGSIEDLKTIAGT
ncbi:unnamed protein product [Lampetra fluviatilis]